MKNLFTKVLLLAGLAASPQTFATDIAVGYAVGRHILTRNMNDHHPYIAVERRDSGLVAYYNSFRRISYAAYYKLSTAEGYETLSFNLKIGATTGYRQDEVLGAFITPEVMLMAVPEVGVGLGRRSRAYLNLVGESVNIGVEYKF